MLEAAAELATLGAGDATVVLHAAEGAVAVDGRGSVEAAGAVRVPDDWVAGATGAGPLFHTVMSLVVERAQRRGHGMGNRAAVWSFRH